ncbi:MAG: carbon-nitrogen hydrolase family protein [Lentisphaeria bacterium]|nr:carbon-nitrogen hydrolase family protein [Lentisphaeria bacterium]
MRIIIMQPPYPAPGKALSVLEWQIAELRKLAAGEVDLVIFPENSNCTGYANSADMKELINGAGAVYVEELRKTARRVNCTIMSGLMNFGADGILRNQLTVFPPDAPEFSPYTKVHLVEPELAKGIEPGTEAVCFEYKGIRFGAAICFDYYFPELFVQYAKQRIDVMVIVSHQRQERPEILEFVTRARAFDCGCTLLRSAPAMPDPGVGGKSMAVSPEGVIIADAGGVPGVLRCEIDPKARFMRPASYGEPDRVVDYREALLLSRSHTDK